MTQAEQKHFERFLDALDDYLYANGWYVNGRYIRKQCKNYEEVEKYLFHHCYSKTESGEIVARIKLQTL